MAEFVLARRGVLRGSLVTALGAAAGYLVARNSAAARTEPGTTAANAYGPPAGEQQRLLLPLDRLPAGGGVLLADDGLVLTRTATGEVHAFSSVCTPQGCTVAAVADGTIVCRCHGSRFDADTGAVRSGPAGQPLPPMDVVVRA